MDFISQIIQTVHKLPGLFQQLGPVESLLIFFASQALMIWRLGHMERKGLEGTVLGTLLMPYCSGVSNLIFAWVMGRSGGSGTLVLENCLVNNVTNLTLLLGLPAVIWPLTIRQKKGSAKQAVSQRLNQLSLILTLTALLFFTGTLWALGRDGKIGFGDGLVLVGVFLFWQLLHVFEVLKTGVRSRKSISPTITFEVCILALCTYLTYVSIESLVSWVPKAQLFSMDKIGWISGFLMVIPNAMLAFYYAATNRGDIVYSSQVGDGHICIPMCVGLFALYTPMAIPGFFNTGVYILAGAGIAHMAILSITGKLSRFTGMASLCAYFYFLYDGFLSL